MDSLAVIPGLTPEQTQKILSLLMSVSPERVILFGSRAMGTFRPGSDIDLALDGGHLNQDDRMKLLVQYPRLNLPFRLDLVILAQLKEPVLRTHIENEGRLLKPE